MTRGLRVARTLARYGGTTAMVLCAGLLGSWPSHAHAAQSPYTITGLGLPSDGYSWGYGIEARGQAFGEAGPFGSEHGATFWGGEVHDLGTLPGFPQSYADSANSTGEAVGSVDSPTSYEAVQFKNGSVLPLGDLGGHASEALGINDRGQVVGASYTAGDTPWSIGQLHAFVYTSSSGIVDLNSRLAPGSGWTLYTAQAINNAGLVVGWGVDPSGQEGGYLYSPTDGIHSLPIFSPVAISNTGYIIGSGTEVSPDGRTTSLSPLPDGTTATVRGVNDVGDAVGAGDKIVGGVHYSVALLFHNGHTADLNTLIPAESGWILASASGIDDHGQIVGTGTNPQGQTEAFLLTPL